MKGLTEQLEVGGDQPDLTPLIDCVFLLLLFFIVAGSLSEETNLFKVELPKAAHSEVRTISEQTVLAISAHGQFALGEKYLPDDKLWEALSEKHRQSPIQTLVIEGDRACPYEKVVMAMDVAEALEIQEITLAVSQEQ